MFRVIAQRRAELENRGLQPDAALLGTVLPNEFLSRFMCSKVDSVPLGDADILGLMLAIIVGGNETTMNLIGNLLWRLLMVPTRWQPVKQNPALIETAIEESLRVDPPVLAMFRSARHDVEVGGLTIPRDAKAMYSVAAVNRDPQLFDNPDEFRLDRPREAARKHASFGSGVHLCLGAGLARMEVKKALTMLIARMPELRLAGEPTRTDGFNVWGKASLPVRWS